MYGWHNDRHGTQKGHTGMWMVYVRWVTTQKNDTLLPAIRGRHSVLLATVPSFVPQYIAMHNVQRILRQTDDVLPVRCQTGINLKHLLQWRRVLVPIFVQHRILVLCFDQPTLFAHTRVIVVEHNRSVLLDADGGGVSHGGGVGGNLGLFLRLHSG